MYNRIIITLTLTASERTKRMASPAQVPNNFNTSPWSREGISPAVQYQTAPTAGPVETYHYPVTPEVAPAPITHPAYYETTPVQQPPYNYQPIPETYPNHAPAPLQNERYDKKASSRGLRTVLIGTGATVAAGAVLATGIFLGSSKNKSNEGIYETPPQATSTSSLELPPLDIYSTDTRGQDYGRQLDVVVPFLEEQRQSSSETFDEGELYDPNIFTGEKKWAQTTLNNFSYDIRTASLQANPVLGRNLLAGTFAPSANSQDSISRQIGSGTGPISFRSIADQVSDKYTSGTIDLGVDQIPVNGETTLINTIDMDTSTAWNIYVTEHVSQNGEHKVPTIVAMVEYGHRAFVSNIKDWAPKE